MSNRYRQVESSPEIVGLAVMMSVRFGLLLPHERGIDISHETVRFWWNRFGPFWPAHPSTTPSIMTDRSNTAPASGASETQRSTRGASCWKLEATRRDL
jgi:hypothetical protein